MRQRRSPRAKITHMPKYQGSRYTEKHDCQCLPSGHPMMMTILKEKAVKLSEAILCGKKKERYYLQMNQTVQKGKETEDKGNGKCMSEPGSLRTVNP